MARIEIKYKLIPANEARILDKFTINYKNKFLLNIAILKFDNQKNYKGCYDHDRKEIEILKSHTPNFKKMFALLVHELTHAFYMLANKKIDFTDEVLTNDPGAYISEYMARINEKYAYDIVWIADKLTRQYFKK